MNSNKALPEIEIDFAGEKKKLVFSTLAFCLLEDLTGKNALDGEIWNKPDVRLLTTLLWAGLKTNHPEITLEEVRGKIALPDLLPLYGTIISAFQRASGAEDTKKNAA